MTDREKDSSSQHRHVSFKRSLSAANCLKYTEHRTVYAHPLRTRE